VLLANHQRFVALMAAGGTREPVTAIKQQKGQRKAGLSGPRVPRYLYQDVRDQ
jgi:hypothetical protein